MPKYKVKIDNNQSFTVKDGFTYEDNLNETLDSAKVVFETEEQVDVQSFDDITIYDDSQNPSIQEKNMLVDSGMDEIAYFEPIEAKRYELNIFSRTKWLERFTCPNLTTTKTKKIISTTTRRFSAQINVSSSINIGQVNVLIPLDDNMSNVVYHSVVIHSSIQNNGELWNKNKYYYNDSLDNNLPSGAEYNTGKYLAVRKPPSGTSGTYKLIDKDIHDYNVYLETGGLPVAPFNNGQVVCNVFTPNNIPYDDPLNYIDLYTLTVLDLSEQSSWAARVGGVENNSHLRLISKEDISDHYARGSTSPTDYYTPQFTFRGSVSSGTAYFELWEGNNQIAGQYGVPADGRISIGAGITVEIPGTELANGRYFYFKFIFTGYGAGNGFIKRHYPSADYIYADTEINVSASSPSTITVEVLSSKWKQLFYPGDQKYYEYYYYNGWVRWGEVTNGIKGNLRNTKDWYQWNDSGKKWDSLTITYDTDIKFARYNSGTGKWSFANTNTSTPYIYIGDSKVYKWDGNTWNEIANYVWNLFKSTSNGWSDQGAINTNNLYTYYTDYYKWDDSNKDWVNGVITQNIVDTYPNGQIVYEMGDTRDSDKIVNGTIAYDVTVNVNTYGEPSVWLFIQRYCNLYLPRVHVRNSSNVLEYLSRYKIASRVESKFDAIKCPEFQWNEPTLREVLTDLMSTANCIPIINNNNEIDYMDLSLIHDAIDISKIERIRSSFVSSDYCNELTVSLKNAIGRSKTRITEYTSLRSLTGEITTENAVLKTQKPIYDIKKIIVGYTIEFKNMSQKPYLEFDITDYVVEKRVWDTFITAGTLTNENQSTLKANHLYYTRGGNTIDGWGTTYRMRAFVGAGKETLSSLEWLLTSINSSAVSRDPKMDIRDIMVKVEYETLSEHSMHIGKYLPSKHYGNRIFDNQSNSYVDVQHQSIFEYCKVNRLGNKIKTMYAIYDNENELPQLGDYITQNGEKLVLFNRKIQYYDSQIVFEGQLTANYVLKDYFTGIMAKKRSWSIAEGKEALDRRDIYKYYLEASFTNKNDSEAAIIDYSKILSAFTDYQAGNSIKWTLIRTIDENTTYFPSPTELYSLESTLEIAGNSIIMSFGLGDNFSAGSYAEKDDGTFHNNDYPYVNDFGEFEKINLYFASYVNPSDGDFVWPTPTTDPYEDVVNDLRNDMIAKGRIKNKVKESAATKVFSIQNINVYKDNREMISGEIQFELCSDTPNILVKNPIWEYSSLYNDEAHNKSNLNIYVSNKETYDLNDEYGKGTIQASGDSITLNNNQISVAFSGSFKSWSICDTNGKILIAVNSTTTKSLYLNLLATRDRHLYNLDREIIDSLDS